MFEKILHSVPDCIMCNIGISFDILDPSHAPVSARQFLLWDPELEGLLLPWVGPNPSGSRTKWVFA